MKAYFYLTYKENILEALREMNDSRDISLKQTKYWRKETVSSNLDCKKQTIEMNTVPRQTPLPNFPSKGLNAGVTRHPSRSHYTAAVIIAELMELSALWYLFIYLQIQCKTEWKSSVVDSTRKLTCPQRPLWSFDLCPCLHAWVISVTLTSSYGSNTSVLAFSVGAMKKKWP